MKTLAMVVLVLSVAGCASRQAAVDAPAGAVAGPESMQSMDRRARWDFATQGLAFDERVTVTARLPADNAALADLLARGERALEENTRDDALWHMARAVRTDPVSADAMMGLGRAIVRFGRTTEAIAAFATAVDLRPESLDARYALGLELWKAGRLDDAEAEFDAIIQRDAQHGPATERLAAKAYLDGRTDRARDLARRARELGEPIPPQLEQLVDQ